jgi:hypothetical protein
LGLATAFWVNIGDAAIMTSMEKVRIALATHAPNLAGDSKILNEFYEPLRWLQWTWNPVQYLGVLTTLVGLVGLVGAFRKKQP